MHNHLRPRVLAAFLVLLTGLVAALPFLRSGPPEISDMSSSQVDLTLRSQVPLDVTLPFQNSPATGLDEFRSEGPGRPAMAVIRAPGGLDVEPPSPVLAPNYESLFSLVASTDQSNSAGSGPKQVRADLHRHRIVDGDTLANLAERYLGSRDRDEEIYEANRQVLEHRELLPVGTEIVIPLPSAELSHPEDSSGRSREDYPAYSPDAIQ